MAFMMKKKRYKFSVECRVEQLTEVPLLAAVLFAKVRLLDGGNFQDLSTREEVKNHTVTWNASFQFVCKMSANASTGVLEPSVLRISVRKECKGGRSYQKLGFVDVNLAELAGAGEAARRCLLEGYDARHRQDNSTLRVRIRMNMLEGDPLFKVPSPSLKHKLAEHAVRPPSPSPSPPAAPAPCPAPSPTPAPPAAPEPREDCGSSIASGSSGFGSLPKKRPQLFGSELLNQTSIMSTDLQLPSGDEREDADGGATLQRQRSGSDMQEGCVMSHTAATSHCPACLQGQTHSRNSSNTSGEMSSKASGYGSSLSQQSQHSRQSSEGGDSSEGGRTHTPGTHIRRPGPKLVIDRRVTTPAPRSSDLSADDFHTPNTSMTPAVASPTSDDSAFATPNGTVLSPLNSPSDNKHKFAVPSYFDRKKQDIISLAKSAANVLPLSNFQIFKQKSLNTIPDFIERQTAKEQARASDTGLFHNFPFLTPLANRKNSLYEKNRLSSCNEDDFYSSPEQDGIELRQPKHLPVELRTVSCHSALEHSRMYADIPPFGHSTPKPNLKGTDCNVQTKTGMFVKSGNRPLFNGTVQSRYVSGRQDSGHELRTSRSGIVTSNNMAGNIPAGAVLRHSHTAACVSDKFPQREGWCRQCGAGKPPESDSLPPTLKHRRPSNSALNPSGGCLVMAETGSLDRAKAALERRKHKPPSLGTAESDSQPGHTVSGRVENTRVNPDSLIDKLLKETNLEQVEDSAETSGLQLFIAKDGTAALGSRQIKTQMSQGGAFKRVVMEDDR